MQKENSPITLPERPTLDTFIKNQADAFPYATEEFSQLFSDIMLASKIVYSQLHKAGLVNITGSQGVYNTSGEEQQKLDFFSHICFIQALKAGRQVCAIISEEAEDIVTLENDQGKYIIALDPLDGSSNIDVNISVGTIFSIYRRVSPAGKPVEREDVLQKGDKQVAAGYILYGTSTMLVYTTGQGVHGFTYDPAIGDFFLSHEDIKLPKEEKIYAINDSYFDIFPGYVKNYVQYCRDKGLIARYIGSLVADFHRNLLKGGIYMYPPTTKTPQGKLRLMFECNALAFIVEQAGGAANDGQQRILSIPPTTLHQRVPLYIGPTHMVEQLTTF